MNEREKCGKVKSSSRRDSSKREKITVGGVLKRKAHIIRKVQEIRASNEAKTSKMMRILPPKTSLG